MKKPILVMLCLGLLVLPGFTSSDTETMEAYEVAQTYIDAAANGDTETMLALSTARHRNDFVANNQAENPAFQIGMLLMSKARLRINDMQKLDDSGLEANISIVYPNLQLFFESTAQKIVAERGYDVDNAAILQEMVPLLKDFLEGPDWKEEMLEDTANIRLSREKGQWKIDEGF